MAATAPNKPFSPEQTRRILDQLHQPAIFPHMTRGWPVLGWTAECLSERLGNKLVRFRLGRKVESSAPLFETQCAYVEASMAQFLSWTRGQTGADHVGPFCRYSHSEYWAYADYKYIAVLFRDQPLMFEDVRWSEFGFEERNGRESTLWVGTKGANTPCHQDSYGCNLVLQVQGRKRWYLFPPEDTAKLYPTRIPYEESSVFSQVDVLHPDLRRFPAFQGADVHVVTLQPGQVLYVPRHWWHYVESMDPITVSVNSWIELESDDVARVGEAVTKTVVCAIKGAPSDDNTDSWLNPTEEGEATHDENMQVLNLAVRACARRKDEPSQGGRDGRAVKRDSQGHFRKDRARAADSAALGVVPFGPHLVPVCRQRDELSGETLKRPVVSSHKDHCAASQQEDTDRNMCGKVQQHKQECPTDVTHWGSHDCADETPGCSSDHNEAARQATITTNDLLDCLLHPEIVARVTELLLEKHKVTQSSNTHF